MKTITKPGNREPLPESITAKCYACLCEFTLNPSDSKDGKVHYYKGTRERFFTTFCPQQGCEEVLSIDIEQRKPWDRLTGRTA